MQTIRRIATEKEQQSFSNMLHYCFQGDAGRDTFPPKRGAIAWGEFEGDDLLAGLIEIPFETNLLGTRAKMLGIGGVASFPEARNSGSVRRLHAEVLKAGKKAGYVTSALHPFSFSFYEKFGFGSLGPCFKNTFEPEEIAAETFSSRHTIEAPDPKLLASEIEQWWGPLFWSQYDFSGAPDTEALGEQFSAAVEGGAYLRACVSGSGEKTGVLVYRIKKSGLYSEILDVDRIAWRDGAAFRALMHFLWTHRGQCDSIELRWPTHGFTLAAMREPRFKRIPSYAWMARPIDIVSILKLKLAHQMFDGDLSFHVHDPCIDGNSGTYRIKSGEILFSESDEGQSMPFHIFSSLLFGAITPYEASLSVELPFDLATGERFFMSRQIFLTDSF